MLTKTWYISKLLNGFEFCNKNLDKRAGSSDWNKNINELTDKQLEYAANDVIYLHKIKNELDYSLDIDLEE